MKKTFLKSRPWLTDWLVYFLAMAVLAGIAVFVACRVIECNPGLTVTVILISALAAMLAVMTLMLVQMGRELKKKADIIYSEDCNDENE